MAEIASPGSPTRLRGHTSPPALARFSPDGKVLVSAANDRAIRVWDGKSGESLQQLQLPAPASSLEFSDQGAILAASDGEQTWLWNTSDWSLLQQVNGSRPQFSGDGSLLATARINAARQQMIDIYTLGVDHPVRTITAEGNWFGFSSDGALLAVAGAQISLWDTSTQTLLWQVDNALTGGRVWFTTQNDGLIISGGDGQLQIYSLKN
jgi:WD40 repeat protein